MVHSLRLRGQRFEAGYTVYPGRWSRVDVKHGEYDGNSHWGRECGDDSLGAEDGKGGRKGESLAR